MVGDTSNELDGDRHEYVLEHQCCGARGFLGATLRYGLCEFMKTFQARTGFPVGTLLVNLLGCLIIWFLGGWSATSPLFSPKLKLFLIIGIREALPRFQRSGTICFACYRKITRCWRWPMWEPICCWVCCASMPGTPSRP